MKLKFLSIILLAMIATTSYSQNDKGVVINGNGYYLSNTKDDNNFVVLLFFDNNIADFGGSLSGRYSVRCVKE